MTFPPSSEDSGFWGSERAKTFVSLGAVLVSVASLAASSYAANRAEAARKEAAEVSDQLKRQELALSTEELANDLLSLSMPHLRDMRSNDDPTAEAACIVAVELSALQYAKTVARLGSQEARRDIENILQTLWSRDLTNRFAYCRNTYTAQESQFEQTVVQERAAQLVDEGAEQQEAAAKAKSEFDQRLAEAAGGSQAAVGTWHAVMASYQLQNCALAQKAAGVFAASFADKLGDGVGAVSVYRTQISNHFAVTIDTGDDKAAAEAWVVYLHDQGQRAESSLRTAEERQNLRFLTGAFLQESRGWTLDPDCPY